MVGHSLKVQTLLYTIIDFPIENASYQIGIRMMEIGQKQLMGDCYFKLCSTVAVGKYFEIKIIYGFQIIGVPMKILL